ncbi:hypothetical protein [Pseudobacteriovorax antillogorgiicola]|uniref:Peptide/nickel transport system permease protein n=1 Tax=Pseudobacteriovorax antillogorgiicola TaxID=1513793 RepID=A0A1Y6CJ67_9BACT|nr:hypothetical protein [Pseudobacteriovorax antillogorgiicola]TCS46121.1 peptide/nickel transport system permease protein [Pseudobacteriovorax antillogorgiicola]SMF69539.1 peptide/nickel transport system permease protein [Pseudobacteriovorax antillogorgiicola]
MESVWNSMFSVPLRFSLVVVGLGVLAIPWETIFVSGIDLKLANQSLSWAHPLGTDHLGRDLLVRLGTALRATIPVIWGTVSLSLLLGWWLGSVLCFLEERPYFKPFTSLIDASVALLAGIPIFLLIFLLALLLESPGLKGLLVACSLVMASNGCFSIRTLFSESKNLGYWQAQESLGGCVLSRVWAYGIRGHWLGALGSQWCRCLSLAVMAEVSLSYLGFGVQEPDPSLGNILSSHFSDYLHGDLRVLLSGVACLALFVQLPRWLELLTALRARKWSQRLSVKNEL